MREVELTWADKIQQEGREEGLLEGKRSTLLQQMTTKFGPVSPEVRSGIEALESVEKLDGLLRRVLTASSLEDMGLAELLKNPSE